MTTKRCKITKAYSVLFFIFFCLTSPNRYFHMFAAESDAVFVYCGYAFCTHFCIISFVIDLLKRKL